MRQPLRLLWKVNSVLCQRDRGYVVLVSISVVRRGCRLPEWGRVGSSIWSALRPSVHQDALPRCWRFGQRTDKVGAVK